MWHGVHIVIMRVNTFILAGQNPHRVVGSFFIVCMYYVPVSCAEVMGV